MYYSVNNLKEIKVKDKHQKQIITYYSWLLKNIYILPISKDTG